MNKIFQNLRNNINKEVTCIYFYHGEEKRKTFLLKGLKEYEYIRFKEEPGYMNFLDYNEYIIAILDSDGNKLYENLVFDKNNYNVKNERSLIIKQKLLYGVDYVSNEEKNSKKYLIKQGLKELEPKHQLRWINYVNLYYQLNYINEIKAIISYIHKINSGMSFYEAEIKVFADEFPNLYHREIVLNFTRYVYVYNDEYIKYLCSNFCTGGEYKSGAKPKKKKKTL